MTESRRDRNTRRLIRHLRRAQTARRQRITFRNIAGAALITAWGIAIAQAGMPDQADLQGFHEGTHPALLR